MNFIDKSKNFILSLDEKSFKRYIYVLISIVLVLVGLIFYRHYSKIGRLRKELQTINRSREEAQVILTKDVQVKKQKKIVDEILEKGKNFKILQYFDSITDLLRLSNNVKDKKVSVNELENLRTKEYSEVKLDASLTGIDMKQLVELLNEFEKNERIYTKNLEIIKSSRVPALDVNITIATLQPKTEEIEFAE